MSIFAKSNLIYFTYLLYLTTNGNDIWCTMHV